MGKHILKNPKCWAGGYNMSGDLSQMNLQADPDIKTLPLFGPSGAVRRMAGLIQASVSHQGLWDSSATGGLDKTLFDNIGLAGTVVSIGPTTGADGEVAYIMPVTQGEYKLGGKHGDLFGFSVSAEGDNLVRGRVMLNDTVTGTGTGVARQLGAVAETQRLYAALHVFSMEGTNPTLTVAIQSAVAEAFADPTERAVFSQVAAPGGWWLAPVAGPIADEWWRVSLTVGGTEPSILAAVVIGIQA